MAESNNNNDQISNAQLMHSIGQLTGSVQALHQGLTARIEDMRSDIRRMEAAQSDRMDRMEENFGRRVDGVESNLSKRIDDVSDAINKRIDGIGTRVSNLEAEDKKMIEKVATMSAFGGGLGGALVTGAIELLKHIN
ncbi:MAG: hypothetical protein GC139_10445 [Sideroxydans sp.]|nr:hypothetical protein [Sideroxydans sp.]